MKLTLTKKQWVEAGKSTGWFKEAGRQIGSQFRETLEESGATLVKLVGEEAILFEDGKYELWAKRDDYAGYVTEIEGVGYEFVRSLTPDDIKHYGLSPYWTLWLGDDKKTISFRSSDGRTGTEPMTFEGLKRVMNLVGNGEGEIIQ